MTSRERVIRTKAVVLRRQNLGEADRLITVYTPAHGKLKAIAKGVRRPQSRKAGHLEPFMQVDLLVARGRDLDVVTQAEGIETYVNLRQDLELLTLAAYVVELLDRFTIERDENRSLFRLLINTLDRLNQGAEPDAVLRYYELRLLELTGYRPELNLCVGCGNELKPQDQFFSIHAGGVYCPSCGPGMEGARRISLSALKVLRHVQRNTFAAASSARIRQEVYRELETLMEDYLSYILETKLNSPSFLRRIRRIIRDRTERESIH